MRSTTEIDALSERARKRRDEERRRARQLGKAKSPGAKLAAFEHHLVANRAEAEVVALRRERFQARREELDAEYARLATEGDGLALDDPPSGSKQAKIEGEIAALDSKLASPRWQAEAESVKARRDRILAERLAFAQSEREQIEKELAGNAGKLAADAAEVAATHVAPLRERWANHRAAYRQLEAALGGARAVGRLDVAEYPIQVGEIVEPIPAALAESDPTIKNAIPVA